MKEEPQRIGEVIEAGSAVFAAQCYKLYRLPPLGSLVKTTSDGLDIYGIVCNATTAGMEPGRRPIARGKDAADQEAIYKASPQLEKLLKSEFEALVVGHRVDAEINHFLPPVPAHIHSFVHNCPVEEVKDFSQSFGFLNILLNASLSLPPDELVAACLRQMSLAQQDGHAFLVVAGKYLANLLGGDYQQLKAILERIKQ